MACLLTRGEASCMQAAMVGSCRSTRLVYLTHMSPSTTSALLLTVASPAPRPLECSSLASTLTAALARSPFLRHSLPYLRERRGDGTG
jgi:hypothetical protein